MERCRYPDGFPKGGGLLRLSALFPRTTEGRYLAVVVFFLILLRAMTFIVWKYPDVVGLSADTEQQAHWIVAGSCLTGSFLAGAILLYLLSAMPAARTSVPLLNQPTVMRRRNSGMRKLFKLQGL